MNAIDKIEEQLAFYQIMPSFSQELFGQEAYLIDKRFGLCFGPDEYKADKSF